MTAKKKATPSTKVKSTKPKATKPSTTSKKTSKPEAVAKKSTPSTKVKSAKPKATKPSTASKKTSKPTSVAKKSSPVKATAKGAKKAAPKKATAVSKKPKVTAVKPKDKKVSSEKKASNRLSKVKEIVTKTLGKSQKEESKSESNAFSFDDALSFLKAKKKSSSKKKTTKEASEAKFSKAQKVQEKKSSKVKKLTTASIDDILGFGAPSVGIGRPIRDESKVPKQWLPYFQTLMSLRSALKGSLGERSSETIGASARESGELSINSSDAGTETFDRDLALSMVANDQEALEEIEDAIDRIFAGTYGICLETKKPINKNRLKAVPFTRFSVDGQNQFERGKIKTRDFGSGSFATLADSTMGEED
jgi:RNA polymerase-binding transcription factor DksA